MKDESSDVKANNVAEDWFAISKIGLDSSDLYYTKEYIEVEKERNDLIARIKKYFSFLENPNKIKEYKEVTTQPLSDSKIKNLINTEKQFNKIQNEKYNDRKNSNAKTDLKNTNFDRANNW